VLCIPFVVAAAEYSPAGVGCLCATEKVARSASAITSKVKVKVVFMMYVELKADFVSLV
jgi:hypothetical protein